MELSGCHAGLMRFREQQNTVYLTTLRHFIAHYLAFQYRGITAPRLAILPNTASRLQSIERFLANYGGQIFVLRESDGKA